MVLPVTAWVLALTFAGMATFRYRTGYLLGMDSRAYWMAGRTGNPYGGDPGDWGAFLYSPLFAQAIRLVAWMPWPIFFVLFAAINAAAFWWLTKPLPWRWRVPVLALCYTEVLTGNISALLAVALVLSVTRPEALALPTLTKVSPGAIGFLWHLARGDLRMVASGALATSALVLVSYLAEPQLWADWIHMLLSADRSLAGPGLPVKTAAAVVVAIFAARTHTPRLLAVAFWLAMPMAGVLRPQPMTVLVAAIRLPSAAQQRGDFVPSSPNRTRPVGAR